jgi:hypothetical protein
MLIIIYIIIIISNRKQKLSNEETIQITCYLNTQAKFFGRGVESRDDSIEE